MLHLHFPEKVAWRIYCVLPLDVRAASRGKKEKRKGKQREIMQIIHIHAYTAPKSTSESQTHKTYLLTYGPGAHTGQETGLAVADRSRQNLPLHCATGRQFLDCDDQSWICNAPQVAAWRRADSAGISATSESRSKIYSGVCPRSNLWTSKHGLYWTLPATGNQCNSWRATVTWSYDLRPEQYVSQCVGLTETVPVWCNIAHYWVGTFHGTWRLRWKISQHGITVV